MSGESFDPGASLMTGTGYDIDRFAQRFSTGLLSGTGTGEPAGQDITLVVRGSAEAANPEDLARILDVLRSITLHPAGDTAALTRWARVLGQLANLRLASVGHVFEIEEISRGGAQPEEIRSERSDSTRPVEQVHSRLARELRECTGLGARVLGETLGVSREQYSRWISGHAISDLRHGQLNYLHTLITDLVRKLGLPAAKVWLNTPIGGVTPVELMTRRRLDLLHRAIVQVPDVDPVVDGVNVALAVEEDNDLFEGDTDEDAWNPYDSVGGPAGSAEKA
ncbi:hypothetical protein SAMN05421505_102216 [Sinosporangium album]|uniref:Uncharacterized protein n=1 Tax=Sinosporangium album TaxID=504805 RepID=A0A1G7S957_9ACTN|nr:hypothetical protein [Sinosporangium album]SDG19597.1 hypothetical protein SAMN05421505_102216 [Sinosporangium album]